MTEPASGQAFIYFYLFIFRTKKHKQGGG